jgi:hypothetical protein
MQAKYGNPARCRFRQTQRAEFEEVEAGPHPVCGRAVDSPWKTKNRPIDMGMRASKI